MAIDVPAAGVGVPADRIDRRIYIDPEVLALEQELVFRWTWQYVCHESAELLAHGPFDVTLDGREGKGWANHGGWGGTARS